MKQNKVHLASLEFTAFESEILDSILWQVKGFKRGHVKASATNRILRATIRKIKPPIAARSVAAKIDRHEIDHAVPVHVICRRILDTPNLDRYKLETIIKKWLVRVELTGSEHRKVLPKHGLSKCMPRDWDGNDPYARYPAAGIRLRKPNAQPKAKSG